MSYKPNPSNYCDLCRRVIDYQEFAFEGATRKLITLDGNLNKKTWETRCKFCNAKTTK